MKKVKFTNGKYGILVEGRISFNCHDYFYYLRGEDGKATTHLFDSSDKFNKRFKDCLGTEEQVDAILKIRRDLDSLGFEIIEDNK